MRTVTSREEIASNVRAEKARRRATDSDLAAVIGTSRSGLNERINGRARFQVDELQKLAAYFEVSLEQLLAPVEVPA